MSFGFSDITDIFNRPKAQPVSGQSSTSLTNNGTNNEGYLSQGEGTYTLESQNWYSAKPYGFKTTSRSGNIMTMFLPISPNNINIQTNFATNVIATLYGTVEEHSDIRYYDIVIEGHTSMAPKFVAPFNGTPDQAYPNVLKKGRSTFDVASSISAGGFFAKSLGLVNQIKNKASDLLNGAPKPKTGLIADNSGYVAFHNLYRFFLQYKKDAAGISSDKARTVHPLTFFNYKDNNEYDCVIRSFTLKRSVQDPMLYHYSIQMRCYNLRSIAAPINEDLKQRLSDLGINGVDSSSILGDIKSLASGAKSIIGAAIGGISLLGR